MKSKIKRTIKSWLQAAVNVSRKTKSGRYLNNQVVLTAMEQVEQVSHKNLNLKFSVPTSLCKWRVRTFSDKEPETLEWIDSILKEGSVFWDVGANIGLYSVYAAKKRTCKVWAFEPSVFNLELLVRNVFLNGLTNEICIVPFALCDQLGSNQLRMTTTEWGGALSTFGQDFGWDGKPIQQVFEYQIPGLTMEDATQKLGIPQPDYIKMDVDGIEHLILKGGMSVMKNVKGILVEVNDDFHEQAEQCEALLSQSGLILKEKRHSDMIANSSSGFANSYNQIWTRP